MARLRRWTAIAALALGVAAGACGGGATDAENTPGTTAVENLLPQTPTTTAIGTTTVVPTTTVSTLVPSTTVAPSPPTTSAPSTTAKPVAYKSCSEVKAAGAAPIRRGEPGYGSHLDRDGDGIACET